MELSFKQAVVEARSGFGRILVLSSLVLCGALVLFASPAKAADVTTPEAPAATAPVPADQPVAPTPAATPDLPVEPAPVATPDVPATAPDVAATAPEVAGPAEAVDSVVAVPAETSATTAAPVRATQANDLPQRPAIRTTSDSIAHTDNGLPAAVTGTSAIAKTPAIPETSLIDNTASRAGAGNSMAHGEASSSSPISATVSRITTDILGRTVSALQSALQSGLLSDAGQTDSSSSQTAGGGANGPAPDRTPAPLPIGGTGSTSSNGFFFFGFAALLVGLFGLRASTASRRLANAPVSWQPVPFLALLERPG